MKTTNCRVDAGGFELFDQAYSPGHTVPWHRHTMAELCFLMNGAFREIVGGATIRYARHEACFKPAGESHRVEAAQTGARCFVLSIPTDRFSQLEARRPVLAGPALLNGGPLLGLCVRAFREMHEADDFTSLVLEGLALEMLGAVARAPAVRVPNRAPPWMERVRERLHEEALPRPTLTELARLADVQPTYLARSFRQLFRCSVGEYLRRLSLSRACVLLAEGRCSLADVACRAGFYDQSHFTRVFRKYMGVTPARYQRQI